MIAWHTVPVEDLKNDRDLKLLANDLAGTDEYRRQITNWARLSKYAVFCLQCEARGFLEKIIKSDNSEPPTWFFWCKVCRHYIKDADPALFRAFTA